MNAVERESEETQQMRSSRLKQHSPDQDSRQLLLLFSFCFSYIPDENCTQLPRLPYQNHKSRQRKHFYAERRRKIRRRESKETQVVNRTVCTLPACCRKARRLRSNGPHQSFFSCFLKCYATSSIPYPALLQLLPQEELRDCQLTAAMETMLTINLLTCNSGVRAGFSRFICPSASAIPRLLLRTKELFILETKN